MVVVKTVSKHLISKKYSRRWRAFNFSYVCELGAVVLLSRVGTEFG
jgi:hypothetical protein